MPCQTLEPHVIQPTLHPRCPAAAPSVRRTLTVAAASAEMCRIAAKNALRQICKPDSRSYAGKSKPLTLSAVLLTCIHAISCERSQTCSSAVQCVRTLSSTPPTYLWHAKLAPASSTAHPRVGRPTGECSGARVRSKVRKTKRSQKTTQTPLQCLHYPFTAPDKQLPSRPTVPLGRGQAALHLDCQPRQRTNKVRANQADRVLRQRGARYCLLPRWRSSRRPRPPATLPYDYSSLHKRPRVPSGGYGEPKRRAGSRTPSPSLQGKHAAAGIDSHERRLQKCVHQRRNSSRLAQILRISFIETLAGPVKEVLRWESFICVSRGT